jgi:hypothetical protein
VGGRSSGGLTRPAIGLKPYDIFSLQAFRARTDLEFHGLTLGERPVAVRLDRREVNENVFACLATDETISLGGVKPLHYTLLSHFYFHLILKEIVRGSLRFPPADATKSRLAGTPIRLVACWWRSQKATNPEHGITGVIAVNFNFPTRAFSDEACGPLK